MNSRSRSDRDGTPDNAGHRGRIGNAQREDDAILVGAEDREQSKRQKDAREGEKRIVDCHDDGVDPTTGVTADETDQRAAHRCECDRQGADPDARPGADDQAAEHVAAEFVGSEPVGAAWRRQPCGEAELHRIIGGPEKADRSGDEQCGNQNAADEAVERDVFHSATTRGSNKG